MSKQCNSKYYPSNKEPNSFLLNYFSFFSLCVKVEKEQTQKSQEKAFCDLHEHARFLKNFSEFTWNQPLNT